MLDRICTTYKDINSKEPFTITIADALERIRSGKSKKTVEAIRLADDKEKANELKKNSP